MLLVKLCRDYGGEQIQSNLLSLMEVVFSEHGNAGMYFHDVAERVWIIISAVRNCCRVYFNEGREHRAGGTGGVKSTTERSPLRIVALRVRFSRL